MTKIYTVEAQTAPLPEMNADVMAKFATAAARERNLRGPIATASIPTRTLSLRSAIAAESLGDAISAFESTFRRAAGRVGVADVNIVFVTGVLDEADEGRSRDELVSGADIARDLDMSRERVRQFEEEPGRFPGPVATLGQVRVYRWGDIEDWLALGGRRKPGRPSSATKALVGTLKKTIKPSANRTKAVTEYRRSA